MNRVRLVLCFSLLLTIAALPAAHARNLAAPQHMTLAFYYQWYEANSWDANRMSGLPLNSYSSDDRATTERQVREAHDAGINAFVSSWQGAEGRIDPNFATLLDVAGQRGDFQATIYFETGLGLLNNRANIIQYLGYVRDNYTTKPAFLRSDGHPVLFFWNQGWNGLSVADWQFVRSQVDPNHDQIWIGEGDKSKLGWLIAFDGLHDYGAAYWAGPSSAGFAAWNSSMGAAVKATNPAKLWVCGVQPGYDDTRVRHGNPVRGRLDGQYYLNSFDGCIAANPDWIIIVSYNEWFEGDQIEPGQGYGNAYLDLTRSETAKYSGSAPPAPPPPAPPPPAPPSNPGDCSGANTRFFDETGQCVCDAFLSYWYANGGLAQFGYPISPQRDETSKTDGKVYAVQWFERARFEWHPEYGNGGAVVQGFLGVDEMQARGYKPDQPPFARTANSGQGQYFDQTGHNLAHGFALYWQTHGGLALNGYPISEEFRENIGGKEYIVQYFQRARFELHPELPPAFIVSLGQLGRDLVGR